MMDDDKRRGLDETRRLLYTLKTTLLRCDEPSAELIGTITNALKHHHPELRARKIYFTDPGWCSKVIDRISSLLGD